MLLANMINSTKVWPPQWQEDSPEYTAAMRLREVVLSYLIYYPVNINIFI